MQDEEGRIYQNVKTPILRSSKKDVTEMAVRALPEASRQQPSGRAPVTLD